jgi:hypothetical protein
MENYYLKITDQEQLLALSTSVICSNSKFYGLTLPTFQDIDNIRKQNMQETLYQIKKLQTKAINY